MITEFDLKNLIQKGAKENVYFLFGDDPYLVKNYAKMIEKAVVGTSADLDLITLDYNAEVAQISENLSQFSFLGGRKCVSVSNLDFEKMSIAEFKNLKELLSTSTGTNCMVLYFDSFLIDIKRSKRFSDLSKIIEENGGVVAQLNHRTEMQLVKLLTDGAKKRGLTINTDTAKFLITYSSNDLNLLVNELNKLCLYKKEGEITKEDIKALCSKSLEASIYNITKFILSKSLDKAIKEINVLLKQKIEAYYIYSEIASVFTDIYYALISKEQSVPINKAAEELGYKKYLSFRLTNALKYANSLGDKKIGRILDILILSDSEVKADNSSLSLEKLIINISSVL